MLQTLKARSYAHKPMNAEFFFTDRNFDVKIHKIFVVSDPREILVFKDFEIKLQNNQY